MKNPPDAPFARGAPGVQGRPEHYCEREVEDVE
jgi:hypothetical protein